MRPMLALGGLQSRIQVRVCHDDADDSLAERPRALDELDAVVREHTTELGQHCGRDLANGRQRHACLIQSRIVSWLIE
ncbi:MAG TPA: hypothetical protein VNN80_11290 [Polyangiaceae bacterium]|nr:hypothetical protein [Polyangiaceae bacterium]